jgi:transmembrane sensor
MPGKGSFDSQKKRNREAADWLLRNSDPNQPAAERARFQAWLQRDSENCRTYSAAEQLMADAHQAIRSDSALADVDLQARNRTKPITALVLVAALLTGSFFALDGPLHLQADMISGTGEMPLLTLEDGSIVQLNASSAIAVNFSERHRVIRLLKGQAFFQVAHASERPFTVVAGETDVTALGTAFDVRFGHDGTDVTVTENAVEMEWAGQTSAPVRVQQGQQAIYDNTKKTTAVASVDGLVALAWRRGQIAVDNAPLSYVVGEMNRHFYGRIVIAGSALAARRVSGTIKVADTDDALAFVTKVFGLNVTRFGPLIVIRR